MRRREIRVTVEALDPITRAGVSAYLEPLPEVRILPRNHADGVDVAVVTFDRLSADAVTALRAVASDVGGPVVLLIDEIRQEELLLAVECGVVAILPRSAVSDERLPRTVRMVADGSAALPPDLLGELMRQVERLQREVLEPRGLGMSTLSGQELDVLRLIADGLETAEIANKLCYSERTVKNVLHRVTRRLNLRNRSHAVAYALRAGMI